MIQSAKVNSLADDIYAIFNTARPISKGGTGATTAAAARIALGLEIGANVQAWDADLDALAAAFTAASASGPASLAFAEDTDNGAHKVNLKAAASIAADVDVVLPSTAGTLALSDPDVEALATTGIAAFSGLLYGLTLSNNGSDATNDIDIAAGIAIDATNAKFIKLASGLTKRLDAAWAVGTNQGGLDTGSIANTTYHLWLIMRSDTGVVDVLFSAHATAPTMPANYDFKRRIGSIRRDAGVIRPFFQVGDYFYWNAPAQDLNVGASTISAATNMTATLPTGIAVMAQFRAGWDGIAGSDGLDYFAMTALTQTDATPSATNFTLVLASINGERSADAALAEIMTDTSARVRVRATAFAPGQIYALTIGWRDTRGRLV